MLDGLVTSGRYANRAAALRAGLDQLARAEREREIAERYRRGYAAEPQEEWVGRAGLESGAKLLAEGGSARRGGR